MKKILGGVALGLGVFLLVLAVLAVTYAPGAVKKTPVDVDSVTLLSGEAARLDTSTGAFVQKPIYARSTTEVDSDASTDSTVVVVATSCAVFGDGEPVDFACVDKSDPNLITAGVQKYASSRTTALGVSSKALPADATPVDGTTIKFPFDAQKKTYPYWDDTTGQAVDAVYSGTEKVGGVEAYVYEVAIDDAAITIGDDIPGTYTDAKTLYIEPRTGAVLNQVDDQQRYLADGTQVLDLQLAFTDDQVATNVADAKDNIAGLDLLLKTIPLVGFIGGGLLLVVGVLVLVRSNRRRDEDTPTRRREPAGAGR
jgi:hypothetical protein